MYLSIYDGEEVSVRGIVHFSCKTCSAQLERGHYSCLQCLSQGCRKCALRHSSSPEEAKHRMRSDFTTRYIGAYYRSEGLPGMLPLRASAGTLSSFGSIIKYTPRLKRTLRETWVANRRTDVVLDPSQCCMTWHSYLCDTGVPRLRKSWCGSSRHSRSPYNSFTCQNKWTW